MKPFFDSWASLGRTALVGAVAYAGLIVFLRVSGKRTLSKMNAFDFVVTVALGSTLAAVLTSTQTPLADGMAALALLIGLQYLVAMLSVRSKGFRHVIKSEPALLYHRGQFLEEALRRERVVRDEILAAMRSSGFMDLCEVDAVVLEIDGTFSVLSGAKTAVEVSTLDNMRANEATERHRT